MKSMLCGASHIIIFVSDARDEVHAPLIADMNFVFRRNHT